MIKIIEGYGFEQDDLQFTLYAVGTRQKSSCFGRMVAEGEMVEYKDILGYYSSLSAMLESRLKHATRKATERAGVENIGDYIKIMRGIANEIKTSAEAYVI